MINIIAAFLLMGAIYLPSLLKAELKTIIVFSLIWSLGFGLALMVPMGIFLPIPIALNYLYLLVSTMMAKVIQMF